MSQQADRHTDDRFNDLSDRDAFWGPLIGFRPAQKTSTIGSARVLTMSAMLGALYGMLLNLALALVCRHTTHHVPPVFVMPLVLTFTYFSAFQLTLGPAWNRRARLLVRRAGYLESIRRPHSDA